MGRLDGKAAFITGAGAGIACAAADLFSRAGARVALVEMDAGGGTVINMSSGAALRGASPLHVYTSAKGAIVALTRAMAGSYVKQNVRVNAICAGRIQTERNVRKYGTEGLGGGSIVDRQPAAERIKDYPLWLGRPIDIANIALFLACDESRMTTGAAIPADGGRSAY